MWGLGGDEWTCSELHRGRPGGSAVESQELVDRWLSTDHGRDSESVWWSMLANKAEPQCKRLLEKGTISVIISAIRGLNWMETVYGRNDIKRDAGDSKEIERNAGEEMNHSGELGCRTSSS